MLFLKDGRQLCNRVSGRVPGQSISRWKRQNMQGPVEELSLHRQASDSTPNTEDSCQPDPSRGLSMYYDLDEKYTTSSSEIWSYYMYFLGNYGTLLYFAPIAFQSLLARAAGEEGVLRFAGR